MILKWFNRLLEITCLLLLVLLLFCVCWQVFSRYVFSVPSTVTDELARFTFIWLALLGSAYAFGHKSHLSLDWLKSFLSVKNDFFIGIFIDITVILFAFIAMVFGGISLISYTLASGQVSPALNIPMGYVYFAVPISGLFIVFYSLINIYLSKNKYFSLKVNH